MSTVTDLIDRYIEMWNETDGVRRRELIAHVWTEGARYLDPVLEGKGRSGIEAMIRGVQERFPGHRFRRTSAVDSHHDCVRFCWELGPEDGPALVKGTDLGIVAEDRLAAITGFFDQAPAATAQS